MDFNEDPRFWSRIVGRTIKLTTSDGVFKGLVINVDGDHTVLLSRVKDLSTNRDVPGIQFFSTSDITHVEIQPERRGVRRVIIPEEEPLTDTKERNVKKDVLLDRCQQETTAAVENVISAVEKEDVQYTVIDKFKPLFFPAIQDLQRQKVLGVAAAGFNMCRNGKLCWLQVASKSKVYLFDIVVMGPPVFKNGLKSVLEDKSILKVIHDCRSLSDCLSHQYGVILSNVFDTQVADVCLFYKDTGGFLPHCTCTVDKCLVRYMDMLPLQVSFLASKDQLVKDVPNIWFMRPMPVPFLKLLSLEVIHLLPLQLAMVDAMMSDFASLVSRYLSVYKLRTLDGLGPTPFSSYDLPEELRQLKICQELRRNKALKEFGLTESGFLVRSGVQLVKNEENLKNVQGCKPPLADVLSHPEKKGRSQPAALRGLSEEANKAPELQKIQPKTATLGVKGREIMPLNSVPDNDAAKYPQVFQSLQKSPSTLGLRNLNLSVHQRPASNPLPVIPLSCPWRTQIRMSAPQLLAKTLHK
ncbi:piRNA biogenesis protein EXD1-like [Spea bombifrons]|uniref:piRNA biogenesis protein EXD1-like n=1 Tax=Spea bombifrons TaxID=233779 RepID=UPI00234A0FD6|nr:piRNA biogenesis protein EXD1-like [Spea bombifrons]